MPRSHHLPVARTARYYTLGPAGAPVREVWFVLHGIGQLAARFITYFRDLDDGTRLIVAPEALNRYYLVSPRVAPAHDRPVGATWMTREDRDNEIRDYVAYLDTLYDAVMPREGAAPPVHLLGFSQGAATAARWVAMGRARPARLILWGGLLPPDLDLSAGAAALRNVPLTIVVGSADEFVSQQDVDAQLAALAGAGIPVRHEPFEGGHAISRAVLGQLAASSFGGGP